MMYVAGRCNFTEEGNTSFSFVAFLPSPLTSERLRIKQVAFHGANTFIGTLYMCALQCAREMATLVVCCGLRRWS